MSDYTVRDYTVDAAPYAKRYQAPTFYEWFTLAFVCVFAVYAVDAEKFLTDAKRNAAAASAKNTADAAKNTADAANTAAYSAEITAYAAKVTAYAVENTANAEKNTADAAKNTADAAKIVAYIGVVKKEVEKVSAYEEKNTADAAKNAADAEKNTADAKRNADNYAWLVRAGAGAKTALAAVEAAKTAPTPSRRVVTTPGGACQAALDIQGIWLTELKSGSNRMPHHVRAELAAATKRATKACGIRLVSDN